MSDEANENVAQPGQWFNTLTGESKEFLEFTVINIWKSRTLFSENRDEEPLCRSADGFTSLDRKKCRAECPYDACSWVGSTPPACAESYNYIILPTGDGFPAILSLMKSSYKTGKALNTLLIAARSPAWYWTYELYSFKETNNKGTFYVASVRKQIVDGKPVPTSEDVRATAENFYRMAKNGNVDLDIVNAELGSVESDEIEVEPF
jgi:hypothetical protein